MNKKQTDNSSLLMHLWRELQQRYPELLTWHIDFDNAKRRAGVCIPEQRLVRVSRLHMAYNPWPQVKDTLLHEVAHALAWEGFRYRGHGSQWKQIACELGAEPKATGHFETAPKPWVLVWFDQANNQLVKLAERYRRHRRIDQYAVRGKPETRGQLFYLSREDYQRWQQGKQSLNELIQI